MILGILIGIILGMLAMVLIMIYFGRPEKVQRAFELNIIAIDRRIQILMDRVAKYNKLYSQERLDKIMLTIEGLEERKQALKEKIKEIEKQNGSR